MRIFILSSPKFSTFQIQVQSGHCKILERMDLKPINNTVLSLEIFYSSVSTIVFLIPCCCLVPVAHKLCPHYIGSGYVSNANSSSKFCFNSQRDCFLSMEILALYLFLYSHSWIKKAFFAIVIIFAKKKGLHLIAMKGIWLNNWQMYAEFRHQMKIQLDLWLVFLWKSVSTQNVCPFRGPQDR